MQVNKHEILRKYVQDFLEGNYLYFQSADAYPDIRMIIPQYGDYIRNTDILGNKYKSYTFVFIGYETVDKGTSDINVEGMKIFDDFLDWVETQKKNGNYPDFGANCFDYDITPLQNMANLAAIDEQGLGKYMLGVRIDYTEKED